MLRGYDEKPEEESDPEGGEHLSDGVSRPPSTSREPSLSALPSNRKGARLHSGPKGTRLLSEGYECPLREASDRMRTHAPSGTITAVSGSDRGE